MFLCQQLSIFFFLLLNHYRSLWSSFFHFLLCMDTGPIILICHCPNPSNKPAILTVGTFIPNPEKWFGTWKVVFEQTEQMGVFSHELLYSKVRFTKSITSVMMGRWQECEEKTCSEKLDAMRLKMLQALYFFCLKSIMQPPYLLYFRNISCFHLHVTMGALTLCQQGGITHLQKSRKGIIKANINKKITNFKFLLKIMNFNTVWQKYSVIGITQGVLNGSSVASRGWVELNSHLSQIEFPLFCCAGISKENRLYCKNQQHMHQQSSDTCWSVVLLTLQEKCCILFVFNAVEVPL